ncbi:TetR/AcrR family transcriptional regulator [Hungatella effluvii]|uniref:TetR/AcrR family transcriptional regulator n=1 Tax=Hungatella effluvii TaxID=1096246 RepID=UPI0022E12162|nr:TetR/AcrR family transcriptional regulator [Hungatella effluvii]
MPTQRFTRLQEEKKKKISEAVIHEFQRTSYGELQISKIARSAHVSRGSLYTYFRDKEDMFLFALNQTWKTMLEYNKRKLIENGGDYWEMMFSSLQYHLRICKTNQIYRLLYLASENAVLPYEAAFSRKRDEEYRKYKEWICEHTARDSFKDLTETEFSVLQDTCQSLLMVSVQMYLHDSSVESVIERDFKTRLLQIKKGACLSR